MRACSDNHNRDCYILKLDIKGFFMHTNRGILFERLRRLIEEKYQEQELQSLQSSIHSYLGLIKHYRTYYIRKKMLQHTLRVEYLNHFYISGGGG